MRTYSRSHLSDSTLLNDLASHLSVHRGSLADVLADLAEVDARKLYLPAGYPSMYAWCVGELHLSEEAAYKRIHAARAARRFPALFVAVAAGRLHLSAVVMLAPHLRDDTADGLIEAATHRTRSELERLLADRFPRPDVPTQIRAIEPAAAGLPGEQHAPGRVESDGESAPAGVDDLAEHAPGRVEAGGEQPTRRVETPAPRPRVAPLAPQRFALQVTIGQRATDNLRRAQELLGVTAGDVAEVLDQALALFVRHLEKRRFAATARPGLRRSAGDGRYVPAEVKRAVWKRDAGRCTFVSDSGHRCSARTARVRSCHRVRARRASDDCRDAPEMSGSQSIWRRTDVWHRVHEPQAYGRSTRGGGARSGCSRLGAHHAAAVATRPRTMNMQIAHGFIRKKTLDGGFELTPLGDLRAGHHRRRVIRADR